MKIEYKNVKSDRWYGKKLYYVIVSNERVEVEECKKCFGSGNIITPETEELDEMDWDFKECPKCDGQFYVKKES